MSPSTPPAPASQTTPKKKKSGVVLRKVCSRTGEKLIVTADVIRLSRRAGIKRVSHAVKKATRMQIVDLITRIVYAAVPVVEAAGRKTVQVEDVKLASRLLGRLILN